MISVKKENPVPKKDTYPHLGVYDDGTVVLFNGENKGVCVYNNKTTFNHIGEYSTSWVDSYRIYDGSITLSNNPMIEEIKDDLEDYDDIPF